LNGLGIVVALVAESRTLGRPARRDGKPAILADGTLLIVSGVGLAAAAEGARRLTAAGARALISWGVAGGLDPALAAGLLVLPREVMSPEGNVFMTAREWRERVSGAIAGQQVCSGRLLTCREPLASSQAKALAFLKTGAVAVDMESSAVAEVASLARLPFLAVRAIVDTAADALPRAAVAAATADSSAARSARLLGALARRPAELQALVRLAGRYRAASRALSAVARSGALLPSINREVASHALP
jgi:adenosylhomocysteine nucleosidase